KGTNASTDQKSITENNNNSGSKTSESQTTNETTVTDSDKTKDTENKQTSQQSQISATVALQNQLFYNAKAGDLEKVRELSKQEIPLQNFEKANAEFLAEIVEKADPKHKETDKYFEIFKILLLKGASCNQFAFQSKTPIHVAASLNLYEFINFMRERDVSPNSPHNNTYPLQEAAQKGNKEAVEALLKFPDSLKAYFVNGKITNIWEDLRIPEDMRLFLEKRLKPKEAKNEDSSGKPVITSTPKIQEPKIVKPPAADPAQPTKDLMEALQADPLDIAKITRLLKAGNIDLQVKDGFNTVFDYAVKTESPEILEQFVSTFGFDATDHYHNTLLKVAVNKQRDRAV